MSHPKWFSNRGWNATGDKQRLSFLHALVSLQEEDAADFPQVSLDSSGAHDAATSTQILIRNGDWTKGTLTCTF